MINSVGYEGSYYIEKIIQFEIDVPTVEKNYYSNILSKYFNKLEIDRIIKDDVIEYIANDMKTYRQLKRYCNYISFRIFLIGNISTESFLYYSYFKLYYPDIMDIIYSYKEILTKQYSREEFKSMYNLYENIVDDINSAVKSYEYIKKQKLLAKIKELFPLYSLYEKAVTSNKKTLPPDNEAQQYYINHKRAVKEVGLCKSDVLSTLNAMI